MSRISRSLFQDLNQPVQERAACPLNFPPHPNFWDTDLVSPSRLFCSWPVLRNNPRFMGVRVEFSGESKGKAEKGQDPR